MGCERDALKAQKNEISDMIQTCLAQQQEEQEDDEQRVSDRADAMDTDTGTDRSSASLSRFSLTLPLCLSSLRSAREIGAGVVLVHERARCLCVLWRRRQIGRAEAAQRKKAPRPRRRRRRRRCGRGRTARAAVERQAVARRRGREQRRRSQQRPAGPEQAHRSQVVQGHGAHRHSRDVHRQNSTDTQWRDASRSMGLLRPSAAVNQLTSTGLLTHASIRFLSWVRTRRPARRSRARRASRSSPISGPHWSRTRTKSTRPFRRCKNKTRTTTIVNLKFMI